MNSSVASSQLPMNERTHLLNRIKSEFIEMPGLQLTPWQAQRLWGVGQPECEAVLGALVGMAFLRRTANGAYVRATG